MKGRVLRSLLTACACLAAAPGLAQDVVDTGEIDTLREALAMAYRTNPTLQGARSN